MNELAKTLAIDKHTKVDKERQSSMSKGGGGTSTASKTVDELQKEILDNELMPQLGRDAADRSSAVDELTTTVERLERQQKAAELNTQAQIQFWLEEFENNVLSASQTDPNSSGGKEGLGDLREALVDHFRNLLVDTADEQEMSEAKDAKTPTSQTEKYPGLHFSLRGVRWSEEDAGRAARESENRKMELQRRAAKEFEDAEEAAIEAAASGPAQGNAERLQQKKLRQEAYENSRVVEKSTAALQAVRALQAVGIAIHEKRKGSRKGIRSLMKAVDQESEAVHALGVEIESARVQREISELQDANSHLEENIKKLREISNDHEAEAHKLDSTVNSSDSLLDGLKQKRAGFYSLKCDAETTYENHTSLKKGPSSHSEFWAETTDTLKPLWASYPEKSSRSKKLKDEDDSDSSADEDSEYKFASRMASHGHALKPCRVYGDAWCKDEIKKIDEKIHVNKAQIQVLEIRLNELIRKKHGLDASEGGIWGSLRRTQANADSILKLLFWKRGEESHQSDNVAMSVTSVEINKISEKVASGWAESTSVTQEAYLKLERYLTGDANVEDDVEKDSHQQPENTVGQVEVSGLSQSNISSEADRTRGQMVSSDNTNETNQDMQGLTVLIESHSQSAGSKANDNVQKIFRVGLLPSLATALSKAVLATTEMSTTLVKACEASTIFLKKTKKNFESEKNGIFIL